MAAAKGVGCFLEGVRLFPQLWFNHFCCLLLQHTSWAGHGILVCVPYVQTLQRHMSPEHGRPVMPFPSAPCTLDYKT